jgi:ribosomal protein S18 acetylase RimI-like enzyme
MSEIADDLSQEQLVGAIEANMFDFWMLLGGSPHLDLLDGPDMIRLVSDLPSPFCNLVLRAQISQSDIDARIRKTLSHFRSRGLPVRWMTSPSTQPSNLGNYLEAHGFKHIADYPGMAVHLSDLNQELAFPSDLSIQPVSDTRSLEQLTQTLTEGYGVPVSVGNHFFDVLSSLGFELNLHHYLGWLKGKPVACASLLLSSGVAGIYFVATVKGARGLGIGSAITLFPLREAQALGYNIATLGSTSEGLGVYRRLGFREFFKFGIYIYS